MAWGARACYALGMFATSIESVASPSSAEARLSGDAEQRLRTYAALLGRWTRRINLVSRGDEGQIWERHVLDSLRLAAWMPAGTARAIDLGSGAGLPGMVLAIATGVHFDLVEADKRKAAFLGEAQRVTGAPVTVHAGRIETAVLAPAGLVTARALAPLETLLGLAAPLLAAGGVGLFPKGAKAEAEIVAARRRWRFEVARLDSLTSPVLRISGLSRG